MSSAIRRQADAVANVLRATAGSLPSTEVARLTRLGMTPRQQSLNLLYAWYRGENYTTRTVDWDGMEALEPLDVASMAGTAQGQAFTRYDDVPLSMRRPKTPYRLIKAIIDRFTGLLFSESLHPKLRVRVGMQDDAEATEFLIGLLEGARLWQVAIQARAFGGAMGTTAVGFAFLDGRLVLEPLDPRWLKPRFSSMHTMELDEIEQRFMYPVEERNARGEMEVVWYWHRRVITRAEDVTYNPAPVGRGDEPAWGEVGEARRATHGFGFVPVVWCQNMPLADDIDGDPDAHGTYEMMEAMDALLSQAAVAITANCDPTPVFSTEKDPPDAGIRKGSRNGLWLGAGGSARFMEITGTGPKAAMEMAQALRAMVLEVSQCVLEHPDTVTPTATEVERRYASMLAKCDVLREQYGRRLLVPLAERILSALQRIHATQRVDETGAIHVQYVRTPATFGVTPDEQRVAVRALLARLVLAEGCITLDWPPYFRPTLDDTMKAAMAASSVKTASLVDDDSLATFLAPYFRVEDAAGMRKKTQAAATAQQAHLDGLMGQRTAAPDDIDVVDDGGRRDAVTLNGAQVKSLLEIAAAVRAGQIDPEAAVRTVVFAFATDERTARELLGV